MCGIAGIISRKETDTPELLKSMVSQLTHRGPDGVGFYNSNQVGLAHARLSIIDLEGGAQPIHNEDKSVWTVFNGEIFNYIELRKNLETKGHRFHTNTDTEVIVHLYEEYGVDLVNHLNGQFAIALWDERKELAVLFRDRVGIQPLFYIQDGNTLYFASEIKALFAVPHLRRGLNYATLPQIFTYWTTLQPHTVFEDVMEVAPGHMLISTKRGYLTKQYWNHHYEALLDKEEAEDVFYKTLEMATKIRLRSDVPVGAYLSGGIDSSVIAALVKRITPEQLRTFSIEFDDKQFNESDYQSDVVKHLGVDHTRFVCSRDDIARIFPDVIYHTEKPILRTAPAPMMLLSKMVREAGYKVVLTGEGADETLAGYDIFRETMVRRLIIENPEDPEIPRLLSELYPWMGDRITKSTKSLKSFFCNGTNNIHDSYFSHDPRWRTTAKSHTFFNDTLKEYASNLCPETVISLAPQEPIARAQYLEFKTLFQGYLISSQGDRMLMANGVEGRFPFLDPTFVMVADSLYPAMKINGMEEKYVLKQISKDLIPESVRTRKKQPYMAPDADSFFTKNQPDYVQEMLSQRKIGDYGYFNPMKVELLLKKAERGLVKSFADNMAFIGILSTQLLHNQFVENFSIKPNISEDKILIDIRR